MEENLIFSAIRRNDLIRINFEDNAYNSRNSNREPRKPFTKLDALDGSFRGTIRARFNKSNLPTQSWHVLVNRLSLQVHTSLLQGIARVIYLLVDASDRR